MNEKETLKKLIEERGDTVAMHTEECILWTMEHPNCSGCPSELGCAKLAKLMRTMAMSSVYEPKSFHDFENMNRRTAELNELILNAETKEELKAVDL